MLEILSLEKGNEYFSDQNPSHKAEGTAYVPRLE